MTTMTTLTTMTMKIRYVTLWIMAFVILGVVNVDIFQNERLLTTGTPIFLELAPVDPRSLIQGDYMALRYAIARDLANRDDLPPSGHLVLRRDERGIASFVRLHEGQRPLAADEFLLRYHQRGSDVYIGAESFFFQEGHADYYDEARYAELRVDKSGESILVGLRGPDLEALGPPDAAR